MAQTRTRTLIEVIMVVGALTAGALMMYALLPFVTTPTQQVVPPPRDMDLSQTLLLLFVAATAIGAPLTAGIVLALVFKVVSPRVPASSSVAPELPAPKPKAAATAAPKELSPTEARVWKVLAALLVLVVGAISLAALTSAFMQAYGIH